MLKAPAAADAASRLRRVSDGDDAGMVVLLGSVGREVLAAFDT
jgi:hypothetical protein